MAKHYALGRIRYWYAYDLDEICNLYADRRLHRQTVLSWIRDGLLTIDGAKPFLVMGHTLSAYLGARNRQQSHRTSLHQLFCMKCREPKMPYRKQVQIVQQGKLHTMKAYCSDCKKLMNKGIKLESYPTLRQLYSVVDVLQLYEGAACAVKAHFPAQIDTQHLEPTQGDLFALLAYDSVNMKGRT